jgi:hypothetical protein
MPKTITREETAPIAATLILTPKDLQAIDRRG